MSLLPDFQDPVIGDRFRMFYPYQLPLAAYPFLVSPESLELSEGVDGKPGLQIQYTRTADRQYGVLRLALRPKHLLDQALRVARDIHPQATVSPAVCMDGFFRLWPFTASQDLDEEAASAITSPRPLTWTDRGQAKFELVLPSRAIEFLAGALSAQAFPYSAYAELQLEGRSPRVSVKVEFDAQDLFSSLLPKPPLPPIIAWNDLIDAFRDFRALPILRLDGLENADLQHFAEAMAHRALAAYGDLIPVVRPSEQRIAMLQFTAPSELPNGRVAWDLSNACRSFLPVVQILNPFDAATQFVMQQGIEPLVVHVDVPSLDLGTRLIQASAQLPREAPVKEIEVELYAPATEHRPRAISQLLSLTPPDYTDQVKVRFSVKEPAQFKIRHALVLNDDQRLDDGRDWSDIPFSQEVRIYINPDALPARLVTVSAAVSLLEQAELEVRCEGAGVIQKSGNAVRIKRGSTAPNAVFVLDKAGQDAVLTLTAHSVDGKAQLILGPFVAEDRHLNLFDFPSYGPHSVSVTCLLDQGQEVFLEFLPHSRRDGEVSPKRLHFTADRPTRQWTWNATDMFRPGFRYRQCRDGQSLRDDWVDWYSITEPLTISPNGVQGS